MRAMTVTAAVMAMAMTVGAAAEKKAEPPPVTVYVVAPVAGQFVDQAHKDRLDSTKDLLAQLARFEKKWRVVTSREEAQVVLEVLGRGLEETSERSSTSTPVPVLGQVQTSSKARLAYIVTAKLTVGEYTTDVSGRSSSDGWRAAAYFVADNAEKWVKDNRANIPAPVVK